MKFAGICASSKKIVNRLDLFGRTTFYFVARASSVVVCFFDCARIFCITADVIYRRATSKVTASISAVTVVLEDVPILPVSVFTVMQVQQCFTSPPNC